jgi:arsenate reductase (thioredoxin)
MKKRVLFICVHNSARSQMAEAWMKYFAEDLYEVESAGFKPSTINPLVVQVMMEKGIDLSQKTTQSVHGLFRSGSIFHYVITVCKRAQEEECPLYPGVMIRQSWEMDNPEDFIGTPDEILSQVRALRDQIKLRVLQFLAERGISVRRS